MKIIKKIFILVVSFLCFINTEAQEPKLMLPIGHTSSINEAQFSPDGKKIVTASRDFTAKIWEAASGKLITDLKGHTSFVFSVRFSPDGENIVTASRDNTAKIWEAASGKLIADLIGHSSWVKSAQFSPDGKKIVTTSQDNTAKIWESASGKLIADLVGHSSWVKSAQFSPDGKKVVTSSDDNTAKIWDAVTGNLIADLKGHTDFVLSAQFSPDGKKIVTASKDHTAKVWDAFSGRLISDLKESAYVYSARFSPDGKKIVTTSYNHTAKIWEADSGNLITDLKRYTCFAYSARFSQDGKKIVTASSDTTANVWDAFSGSLIADLRGHKGEINSAEFSPDGKKIVTASEDHTAKIWDVASGNLVADLRGYSNRISSAQYSPDGKKIVTASGDNTAKIWESASGKLIADLNGHTSFVYSAQYSPDGKKIVTASGDSTAKIWDAASGEIIADLKRHIAWVNSAQFSPDGKKIVTASEDHTAKIWDGASGKLIADLKGHTDDVKSAQFSPDGKKIVTASFDNTIKIWNAVSGQLITDLKGNSDFVYSAQFSPDGKKIVTAYAYNNTKILDAASGQLITELKSNKSWKMSARFSPDGKKIVTASGDNTVKVWNAVSGELIIDLKGHTNSVFSAEFSPDGKKIVTTSWDNTAKIWDAETGNILYTFFSVDDQDFLTVDKYNRYDGTEGARKLLYFTCGTEVIELEQVKDQLWVPNLAERIMNGDSINAKTLNELNICSLTPEVEDASSKADEYYFKITPRRGGIGETAVFVNGIEVQRYKPEQMIKNADIYELQINKLEMNSFFIAGQENTITLKAYTSDNDISSRGIEIKEDKTKQSALPPNLYAAMIGVSDYKGDELDLKYAAKDATDISNAISNASKKLLNSGGKEHVFMYNLTTAKGYYQLPEKNSIKKILEEIGKKAMANDILLIFFAGHGVMSGEADKKQFNFLTADASSLSATSAIKDVGISTTELIEWMKPSNIKAQKRILIFDACNSGQVINDLVMIRNDDESRRIKSIEKLNERSGMIILSASASNQNAYESGRFNQGFLTYAMLKTLKQRPDILEENRFLNISRWFDAAGEMVVELSREYKGARQDPQIFSNSNFPLGIVDDKVRAAIILPPDKPLFAGTKLLNIDQNVLADDLGLSRLIDNQLTEFSSRGTDAFINFMSNTTSSDAYSVNGIYEIKTNEIKCKINLRQVKETKYSFEVKGVNDDLNKLAGAIAERIEKWIKENQK